MFGVTVCTCAELHRNAQILGRGGCGRVGSVAPASGLQGGAVCFGPVEAFLCGPWHGSRCLACSVALTSDALCVGTGGIQPAGPMAAAAFSLFLLKITAPTIFQHLLQELLPEQCGRADITSPSSPGAQLLRLAGG